MSSSSSSSSSSSPTSSKKKTSPGKLRLLDFLRQLLKDPQNSEIIIWENEEKGEFRLVKPHSVALKWGMVKGNPNMTYDKMSRGLRYFYENKKTLAKLDGKNCRYCFLDTSDSDVSLEEETPQPLQFSIERLLRFSDDVSIRSSPSTTSSSSPTSSGASTSSTSSFCSPEDVNVMITQIIPQLTQEFEMFKMSNPVVLSFPLPVQIHIFFQTHPVFGANYSS